MLVKRKTAEVILLLFSYIYPPKLSFSFLDRIGDGISTLNIIHGPIIALNDGDDDDGACAAVSQFCMHVHFLRMLLLQSGTTFIFTMCSVHACLM